MSLAISHRLSGGTVDISEVILYEGTDDKAFEPYVGGQSSPSPDYPQTIHNVSGHNEFLVQNAINIFNMEEYVNQNSYYFDYSNEGLTIKHKDNRAIANVLPAINVEGNTSYYIKSDIDITVSVAQYTNTGTWITTASVQNNQEFTTDINAKTIKLKIGINISSFPTLIGKVYFSTSKEYKKQTAEFTLVEGQKMYEGDYLADDGIHHIYTEVTLDGSDDESFGISTSLSTTDYTAFQFNKTNIMQAPNTTSINLYCNKLLRDSSNHRTSNKLNCWVNHFNSGQIGFHLPNTITTVEELRVWLSTNNLIIQYKLKEEIVEPYTELQQQQYNRLKKILSYYQQTNVNTISAGDLEAILNLDYKKSNRLRIDALEQAIISLGGNI